MQVDQQHMTLDEVRKLLAGLDGRPQEQLLARLLTERNARVGGLLHTSVREATASCPAELSAAEPGKRRVLPLDSQTAAEMVTMIADRAEGPLFGGTVRH
ncbi:hypothetical protein [Streptomyces sp. MNP-20]|uniref:hypothetical protein n=1 Tax=Streptomyces sp. MNP-20 TaxID=2721165 RepID=UPI0015524BB8|nr:hypothetical protein [Streptomyces sp. MNP-20]